MLLLLRNRDVSRKKGIALMRAGKVAEGRSLLRRSLDISHEMALQVIKICRRRNIDCIVAPYEADSQLGYLSLQNIAQVIITEDSDLLLFGCKNVSGFFFVVSEPLTIFRCIF